eukprot:SAG31_NODE_1554_length_7897_cov_13.662221_5_plen_58_part_00
MSSFEKHLLLVWLDDTFLSGTIKESVGHLTALSDLNLREYAKIVDLTHHLCIEIHCA